jgi:hypothetical protein
LWRAGVGVTGRKPKTMGENLSGNRAARLETARARWKLRAHAGNCARTLETARPED